MLSTECFCVCVLSVAAWLPCENNVVAFGSLAEVQAEKVHYKNVLRKVRKSVPFEIEISDDEDNIANSDVPDYGGGKRY